MSENKCQFHVGDWVELKPFMLPRTNRHIYWNALFNVHLNNPHQITAATPNGGINIAGYPFDFSRGLLCSSSTNHTNRRFDLGGV